MTGLDELYREVILDHYRNPRKQGTLSGEHVHAEGSNPSCGDEFFLDVAVTDGVVTDAAMRGQGCSISQASGSMMMDIIVGRTVEDVRDLTHKFKLMMSIEEGDNPVDPERPGSVLGDLEALQGVRKFPVRIKCADLPWATLTDALDQTTA
ncbi:MAG: SUF system NifU family Fe-S cluster assembly protein [Actinomycetota bacterium]|nr:SUF system NifU family Fe-S cluster assembly protein [Actinomycetota bacterium]MDK1017657.1 SUF system NifU family Fe-S cluster assembly protein [Actinomycetota bacterium]MDK1027542.1 SUF system NifU family Fe-S cluster assembly protein [Actinomycetota bacterium]MDK1038920.1 SUF system NifU family Fe-S cluster assembly protein [Actinomycetota bacterium]MDK1097643.1 SUF system NifU family Fe-S cluster assembly protein [Actinomycetota bacterium]